MAQVREVGDQLVLELSFWEKLGAFHGSPRAPKSALVSVEEMKNPWNRSEGMTGARAPGTGMPGVIMLGTLRRLKSKDFAAVYGRRKTTVYVFSSGPFQRWIVSEK